MQPTERSDLYTGNLGVRSKAVVMCFPLVMLSSTNKNLFLPSVCHEECGRFQEQSQYQDIRWKSTQSRVAGLEVQNGTPSCEETERLNTVLQTTCEASG